MRVRFGNFSEHINIELKTYKRRLTYGTAAERFTTNIQNGQPISQAVWPWELQMICSMRCQHLCPRWHESHFRPTLSSASRWSNMQTPARNPVQHAWSKLVTSCLKKKKVTIWNGTEIICNANACSKFLVPNFYEDRWTQETCDPSMMRPQEVAYFCYFILWYLLWRSQRQSKQNQLIRREAWCVRLICFYFFPFVNTGNSFFIWMTAGMMGSRKR